MNGILPILRKEFREIWRDPYTLGIAIFLPLVLLFLFAYALNLDVKNIPLAVVDLDHSPRAAPTLTCSSTIDGTFPTSARVIQGYAAAINEVFTGRLLSEHFTAAGLRGGRFMAPAVVAVPRVRYNPAMKSVNFIVPGLIGVILMAFPPLLSALAIVREKERGSIQQIFVSPLRPWAFIVGKLIPYVVIAFGELVLVLLAARYWFRVPLVGNVGLFLLASVPYVISTVAIGVLVSTVKSSSSSSATRRWSSSSSTPSSRLPSAAGR